MIEALTASRGRAPPAREATIYPYLLETIVIDRPKQGQAQQAWVLRRVLVASSKPSRPDDREL